MIRTLPASPRAYNRSLRAHGQSNPSAHTKGWRDETPAFQFVWVRIENKGCKKGKRAKDFLPFCSQMKLGAIIPATSDVALLLGGRTG
jgi:hypothetical protein